jgi:hypothetical protein
MTGMDILGIPDELGDTLLTGIEEAISRTEKNGQRQLGVLERKVAVR